MGVAVLVPFAIGGVLLGTQRPDSRTPDCLRRPPQVQHSFETALAPASVDVLHGSLTEVGRPVYEGRKALQTSYEPSMRVGFARVSSSVSWAAGEDVWFGGAFFFPPGFRASNAGVVDIMRWDNYATAPADADHGGLTIWNTDGRLHLISEREGRRTYLRLMDGPVVPEGTWLWLEVHQRLGTSSGSALNELYVNGLLVGRNHLPNYFGRPVRNVRWGLVALASDKQRVPVVLYVDRATASRCEAGPRDW